jgi:CMP-N-acetylneuraminic acid synthetase/regulator of RNase E activity RraA
VKVAAFLPAKGSSQRIENKNTKLMDGKPLFLHTLEKLMRCRFIDEVYLDTDSDEIIELASETGCRILRRDKSLASNATDGNALLVNEASQIEADVYVQAICTSPFIRKDTIRKAVESVIDDHEVDSATLVRKEKLYLWRASQPLYRKNPIPNSETLEDTIIETMGLYVITRNSLLENKTRVGMSPKLIEASPLEAVDVNWPADFELAELIASGLREKERKLLANIKNQLTSAMLSDLLDEFGVKGVLSGYSLNIKNKKVFGRAKTLKLRALEPKEDPKGIYKGLKTYDSIIPNDIIVVQNEVPELAYFGELNASLALRSGACGAIIGGRTRDSAEVSTLDFPVFSKGTTCKDVKNRATVESFNKTIHLDGVRISPDDLIFGDCDGIIVIPRSIEDEVLARAFEVVKKERNILVDIANGLDSDSICAEHGYF